MADEMSQEELDALLNADPSGQSEEPRPQSGIRALVNILQLSDHATQWLVRDVEQWNLVRILAAVDREVQEKILRNVSVRRRADLQEQLERGYSFNDEKVEELCLQLAQEADKYLPQESPDFDEPADEALGLVARLSDLNERSKGQRQLDLSTIAGLILALLALLGAVHLEEALSLPTTALVFVFLGALAAVCLSSCPGAVLQLSHLAFRSFTRRLPPDADCIAYLIHCADIARTNGILALETDIDRVPHPSLRLWLQLAVDGTEPDLINDFGRADIAGVEERHRSAHKLMAAAGFGALLAGLIGLGLWLIFLPEIHAGRVLILPGWGLLVGGLFFALRRRLQHRTAYEIHQRKLMLEGITAVQQGDHPHLVQQRLEAFVSSPLLSGELGSYKQYPGLSLEVQREEEERESEEKAAGGEEWIGSKNPPILSQEELDALLIATATVDAEEDHCLSPEKEGPIEGDPIEMEMLKMMEEEENDKQEQTGEMELLKMIEEEENDTQGQTGEEEDPDLDGGKQP